MATSPRRYQAPESGPDSMVGSSAWRLHALPRGVVIGTLILSLTPAALILLGVDLSLAAGQPRADAVFHAIVDWTIVGTMVMTAALALAHAQARSDWFIAWVAGTLLCVGLMRAFHALVAAGVARGELVQEAFLGFSWTLSNAFFVIGIGAGAGVFLVARSPHWLTSRRFVVLATIGCTLVGTVLVGAAAQVEGLPTGQFVGAVVPRPYDTAPLALFIVLGAWLLPKVIRRRAGVFAHALCLSMLPHALAEAHMAFGSRALYDANFNAAHTLKVLAYLLPAVGLVLDYARHVCEVRDSNVKLQREVRERRVAEARARAIFENAGVGMAVVDQESRRFVRVNARLCEFLGRAEGELLELTVPEVTAPEDRATTRGTLALLANRPAEPVAGFGVEKRYLRGDGRVVWGRVTVVVSPKLGSGLQSIAVVQDITAQRLAEQRFRTIFSQAGVGMVVVDLSTGRFLQANARACAFLGYSESELQHKTCFEVTAPEDLEESRKALALYADPRTTPAGPYELEKRYVRKDGAIVWAHISVVVAPTLGDVLQCVTVIQDITENREAQAKIQRQMTELKSATEALEREVVERRLAEERLGHLIEHLPDATLLVNQDSRIEFINAEAERLLGYARAELEGELVHRLVPGYVREEHPQKVASFFADPTPRYFGPRSGVRAVRQDGSHFPVDIGLAPVETPEGPKVIAVLRDLTEQMAAQERIRLQAAAIDAAVHGVVIADREGVIQFVNPAMEALTGYTSDETIGCTPRLYKSGAQSPAFYEKLWSTIRAGQAWHGELVNRRKDGSEYAAELSIAPVFDATGELTHFVAITRDVTARREAVETLARQAADLERSNADLDRFASAASHDMAEPLRMVTNYLQLIELRYGATFDADGREFIDFAVRGARRMRELLDGLLAYSRVDSRGQDFVPVCLEAVLEAAEASVHLAVQEAGAIVTHDPLPRVLGDAVQLTQVFQNLLGNAIKFCDEQAPEIHVGAARQGRKVLVSVRDNGIGIDPSYFERVFKMFQRLHGANQYPGTGIGLALCKRIVERHGGRLWVESALDRGATFYFTLPRERVTEVTSSPETT